MSCQRCSQRLTRHHDEMKCVSCGFSVEIAAAQIKPMTFRHLLPYIGEYPALRGRQMEYKYKQVEKQQSFETFWGNKQDIPNSYKVPTLVVICPYCGQESIISRHGSGGRYYGFNEVNGEPCRRIQAKCEQGHFSRLLETKSGEFVGWQ